MVGWQVLRDLVAALGINVPGPVWERLFPTIPDTIGTIGPVVVAPNVNSANNEELCRKDRRIHTLLVSRAYWKNKYKCEHNKYEKLVAKVQKGNLKRGKVGRYFSARGGMALALKRCTRPDVIICSSHISNIFIYSNYCCHRAITINCNNCDNEV